LNIILWEKRRNQKCSPLRRANNPHQIIVVFHLRTSISSPHALFCWSFFPFVKKSRPSHASGSAPALCVFCISVFGLPYRNPAICSYTLVFSSLMLAVLNLYLSGSLLNCSITGSQFDPPGASSMFIPYFTGGPICTQELRRYVSNKWARGTPSSATYSHRDRAYATSPMALTPATNGGLGSIDESESGSVQSGYICIVWIGSGQVLQIFGAVSCSELILCSTVIR